MQWFRAFVRSWWYHDELSFCGPLRFGHLQFSIPCRPAGGDPLGFVINSRFSRRMAPRRLRLQRSDRLLWVLLSRWWPGWRRSLQWQANLRVLEVREIKSVPYVPLSHPFVERLIGTIRRECLDHTLFWTSVDLENKLLDFRTYYNHHRTHHSREGRTPDTPVSPPVANLGSYRWQAHCRGLYQTPVAAWFFKESRFLRHRGQRGQRLGLKPFGVGVLHRSAFREFGRFPAPYQFASHTLKAIDPVIVLCGYDSWAILYAWVGNRVEKIWIRD